LERHTNKDSYHISQDYITELKDEFANYLRNQGRIEDRIKKDCSWAFFHP